LNAFHLSKTIVALSVLLRVLLKTSVPLVIMVPFKMMVPFSITVPLSITVSFMFMVPLSVSFPFPVSVRSGSPGFPDPEPVSVPLVELTTGW